MINGRNFFGQPVKNYLRTYDNIWKITAAQRDYHATGCLLDLSKQQALDADPKAVPKIKFIAILNQREDERKCFIIEKAKKKSFWIFQKEPWQYYNFFFVLI